MERRVGERRIRSIGTEQHRKQNARWALAVNFKVGKQLALIWQNESRKHSAGVRPFLFGSAHKKKPEKQEKAHRDIARLWMSGTGDSIPNNGKFFATANWIGL